MPFTWVRRTDDELQWTWDGGGKNPNAGLYVGASPPPGHKAITTDKFVLKYPRRQARGVQTGRLATRADGVFGTLWDIDSGEAWAAGALLRLKDPDNSDFSLVELTSTTQTTIAVAAEAVSSGRVGLDARDLQDYLGNEYPAIHNVTSVALFSVADVNSTTPTTALIDTEASVNLSSGVWTIDVTGSGRVAIVDIDLARSEFIVRFLDGSIQDNPGD